MFQSLFVQWVLDKGNVVLIGHILVCLSFQARFSLMTPQLYAFRAALPCAEPYLDFPVQYLKVLWCIIDCFLVIYCDLHHHLWFNTVVIITGDIVYLLYQTCCIKRSL